MSRLSIPAGLLVGVVVAVLVLGGIVVLAPDPVPPPTASPIASISPSPTAVVSSGPPTSASLPASASPSSGAGSSAFHVGQPAPALVVVQVGGGTIDLASLKGKPVWIDFMATRCPSCQDEFRLMNGFVSRYAKDGLVVIAVDVNEDEGTVLAFATNLSTTFPMGLDSDGTAQAAWGAIALPVHFWIDAQGIVRHGALGGIGPDIMAEGLRTILPGVDVTP